MPFGLNVRIRPQISPSAPTELAWLAHLVAGRSEYCGPALRELDQNLLPGLIARCGELRQGYQALWPDALQGSTELLVLADQAGQLMADDPLPFLAGLEQTCSQKVDPGPLRSELEADRLAVVRRLERLRREPRLRQAYSDWLERLWAVARPVWEDAGRAASIEACAQLERRFGAGEAVARWLSPRHPAAAWLRLELAEPDFEGRRLAASPLYFCMSGGTYLELPGLVHLGLPGNSLAPTRRFLDASQVASMLKVLSEPARVTVLLHLLTDSGGVMDISRRLGMSQPVVSGHLKQLREAGLVSAWSQGQRTTYSTDLARVERVLEDARSLIAQWKRPAG